MADKRKKIKVDNRVKKMAANSEWTRNVLKSMGFTAADIVKDLMPNTSEFVRQSVSSVDMVKDMRSNMTTRQSFGKQFKNIPQIREIGNALNTIKNDIKSGNLAGSQDFNDDLDFGIDSDFFVDDGDSGVEFIDDNSNQNTKPIIVDTLPVAKMINASTEATVNTMVAVADQQMAVETEKMMFSYKATDSILSGLSTMNDNLATLVKFNAESTAKYHAASLKFYEESIKLMEKAYKNNDKNPFDEFMDDDAFDANGNLNMKGYLNHIKKNISDMKDSSMAGMVVDNFLDPDILKMMLSNPTKGVMNLVGKKLIPNMIQTSLKAVDESFSALLPAVIARINTFENDDSELLKNIYKVLGVKEKVNYDIKLDKYEKGAISWDGESKKALVEVIPTYLRRIESALTGEKERMFDYDKGNFIDVDRAGKRYEQKLREKETSGYLDTKLKLRDNALKASGDYGTVENFMNDLEKYLSKMTKKGSLIRPFKTKNKKTGEIIDELDDLDIFDGDQQRKDFFVNMMRTLSKKDLTRMAVSELNESRRIAQKYIDDANSNSNLSGANVLFNESYFDKDGKAKRGTINNVFSPKDKFGLSQLDYLRDIRKALIHGIKVFPDNRIESGSNWNPNIDLISKETNEYDNFEENEHNTENTDKREEYNNIFNLSPEKIDEMRKNANRNQNKGKFGGKISSKIDKITEKSDALIYEILFGKEYTGEEDDEDVDTGLRGQIMKVFTGDVSGKVKNIKDGAKGLIGDLAHDFIRGFEKFRISLFGEKGVKEQNDNIADLTTKIKERMPKAIRSGLKSAVVKSAVASQMGALGSLILPGGPIGAALIGVTTSFLKQSETFNRWMFGEMDEDGNRTGGVIPQSLINLYNEYGKTIKRGAGAGILASFFLPGGPVLGAITGIGAGLATKSEAFQRFLYGEDFNDKDNRSMMNGAFGKMIKKLSKNNEASDRDPHLAAFLGGTGLVAGIAQGVGLLPSMLLPGGPIVGSIIGLSAGIAASSEKFQKFLFGEKDIDGKRYGGLMTKFTNWFDTSVLGSIKLRMQDMNDKLYEFLHKKVLFPIQDALEPIKQAGLFLIDDIKESFKNVVQPVVDSFTEHVTKPLGDWLKEKIMNPITKTIRGLFGLLGKAVGNIVTSPIKLLTGLGNIADRLNEHRVLKEERNRRKDIFRERARNGEINGFKDLFTNIKGLRISDEEKQQLYSEKLSYKANREKNQEEREAQLQAEMEERQNKRNELQAQFEEDMKFGKNSGWKYASKRQKEKRERELKEKQAWYNERNAINTEDIKENTGAMSERLASMKDLFHEQLDYDSEQTNLLREMKNYLYKLATGKDPEPDVKPKINGLSNPFGMPDEEASDSDDENITSEQQEVEKPSKKVGFFKSIINALRKNGQSHEDGLDEVPSDGYVAELHEGEMVLPKGPADFLRNNMGGQTSMFEKMMDMKDKEQQDRDDNALGLTDEEAYRLKEIKDLERYEQVSSKDVGSVMKKREEERKEKEEKQWKNSILEAIYGVGAVVGAGASAATDLAGTLLDGIKSMISDLGLTDILALIAGGLGVAAYDKYKTIADENNTSVLDVAQGDFREERKDADGSYVYDNQVISGGNKLLHVGINGGKKVAKAVGKTINNVKNTYDTLNTTYINGKKAVNKLLGKNTDEVVEGAIKNVDIADDVAKKSTGLIDDFLKMCKKAMTILSEKAIQKFPKLKSIANIADDVFKKLAASGDTLYKKFGTKISAFIADLGLDFTGVGTVVEVAITGYDILTGYYGGNVGNLFGVPKDHVDMDMRNITAFLQGLCKFSFMAIIWLTNEITSSLFGLDFLQYIARFMYKYLDFGKKHIDMSNDLENVTIDDMTLDQAIKAAGGDPNMFKDNQGNYIDLTSLDDEDLKGTNISSPEIMELSRLQYNQQHGTQLDSLAWKDKQSQTFGAMVVDTFTKTDGEKRAEAQNKVNKYQERLDNSDNFISTIYNQVKLNKSQTKLEELESGEKKPFWKKLSDAYIDKSNVGTFIKYGGINAVKDYFGRTDEEKQADKIAKEERDVAKFEEKVANSNNAFTKAYNNMQLNKNKKDLEDAQNPEDQNFWTKTKDLAIDSSLFGRFMEYGGGKEWVGDKVNSTRNWVGDKVNSTKNWVIKEKNASDDVADIMAGDNSADANLLSTAISMSSKGLTAVWNKFAGEDAQLGDGDLANAIATMINRVIVTPFQNLIEPIKEKFSEAKEAIGRWINDVKETISGWWTENVSTPFNEWIGKKKQQWEDAKEKANEWMNNAKETISGWYTENIKEPFNNWKEKNKKKLNDAWDAAKDWVGDLKKGIVDAFNKYIKDPVGDALSPVTTAVGNAWNTLKEAFKPLTDIFSAMGDGDWKKAASVITGLAKEGEEKANAKEDNKGAGKSGIDTPKIKPIKYGTVDTDYIKPAGTTNNTTTNNNTSNKFVFYNQADSRWGNMKIGGSNLKDSGCGPTSLAMAVSQMTGEQITPDTIAQLGSEHLPGYSKFSLFPSVADRLDMNYEEGTDKNFISTNLKRGVPVILSGRTNAQGTPYTSAGHVVTATHINGDNVFIQDPRGKGYSRYYPINSLMIGLNKGMVLSPSVNTDVSKLSSGHLTGWDTTGYDNTNELPFGIYGESGEYSQLGGIGGKAGAAQVTTADKVLSYARAFLNNTSKFQYSQPKRLEIDNNGNHADCSSFVSHVLSRAGDVDVYGTTSQVFWDSVGTKVDEPQIGDVVCQENHVGLYSGNGNYIHMSGKKDGIKESKAIQRGNNPHRGYKRVLKNPSAMVDPTVANSNSLLGTVVATSSGQPVSGGNGGPQASLDKALLIGDSLTVGIKSTFEGKYPNAHAMGKGGKWATQWLDSLSELPSADEVSTVIQWLGINGVHNNKVNLRDSQALLTKLKEKYPGKPIFNMRIFPTTEAYGYNGFKGEWWRGLSQEFNNEMSSWAGSNGVTQIDATNGFILSDGFLDPSKAVDGIHFTSQGYKDVLANMETAINSYNSSNTGTGSTTGTAASTDIMGVFSQMGKIANNMIASIFNGKEVDLYGVQSTTNTTTSDGTSPDISGISDNAQAIWTFFTGKGYSPAATAGIMGNLQQESGLDPTIKQHGGGVGRGLAQWTVSEERFKGLEAHAKSKGKDWTDLQSQLEWIDMEMNGKDAATASHLNKRFGGIEGFKKATDTNWAVEAFEKSYERAGKPNYPARQKFAQNFYSKFANAGTGYEIFGDKGPATATSAESAPSDGSIPTSMNGWAYYSQSDPKWGGSVGGSTVSRGGCGPTSHAMMLSTIFGQQINPLTMTKWANANGTWNGAMLWEMPKKVAKEFGLGMETIVENYNGAPDESINDVKAAVKAGKPVILSGKSTGPSGSNASYDSPFTPGGHIVLAVGVDGNNNLIINDPRSAARTKAYTDKGIMNYGIGLRGAWAFDTEGGKIPSNITSDGSFAAGSYTGTTATASGGTTTTPSVEQMGVFAKMANIGTNAIASIFNGYDVSEATSTTSGGGTSPTGDSTWSGTKYDLSSYDYSDLSAEKQAHINAIIHPALETYKTHNLFPSVTIGQSAHESYWGPKSGLATKAKNLFGIKCGSKWKGKSYSAKTKEEYSPGTMTTITDNFRAYDSYADSVIDRANFLSAKHYVNAGVLSATTPDAQIEALKKAGYATDSSYVTKLKKIVHDNNLTRFDTPNPPKEASGSSNNAGMGDGKTHWANGFAPSKSKVSYSKGHAGMGDGKATAELTSARRTMEKTIREIDRNMTLTSNTTNISATNISDACVEVLKTIVNELHAINANTAATAQGISEIEIVSANTPISSSNLSGAGHYNNRSKKNNSIIHSNPNTGYDIARRIASYK